MDYNGPYMPDGKPAARDEMLRKKKGSSSGIPRERRSSRDVGPTRVLGRQDSSSTFGAGGGGGPVTASYVPSTGEGASRADLSAARGGMGTMAAESREASSTGSTERRPPSARQRPDVPGLSSMSGAVRPPTYDGGGMSARPSTARRTINLAPQRAQEPSYSIPAPSAALVAGLDAEAASKTDKEREAERERRLQEKREKRRLMMERESLELQGANNPADTSSDPVVALTPTARVAAPAQLAPAYRPAPAPAPAPSPVKAPAPAKAPHKAKHHAKGDEDGDGYDDDFEAYSGDEFEDEENGDTKEDKRPEAKKPSPAPAAAPARSSVAKSFVKPSTGAKDTASPQGRKGAFKVVWGSAIEAGAQRRDPKAAAVGLKLSATLNPRAQRAKQILQLVELDQQRFVAFDQQPVHKFEMYQRRLWGSNAPGAAGSGIRQVACQTNDDNRAMESQTEEIVRSDKAMQFYLGDDTDFFDAIKKAKAAPKEGRSRASDATSQTAIAAMDDGSILRLLSFLQRLAPVCETLLEENLTYAREEKGEERKEDVADDLLAAVRAGNTGSMFAKDSAWVEIPFGGGVGGRGSYEEKKEDRPVAVAAGEAGVGGWQVLLACRAVKAVLFNPHQPNVVMSVHGPAAIEPSKKGNDGEEQVRARVVAAMDVLALWDAALLTVGKNSGPSKLLCAEGGVSCSCFGPGLVSCVVISGTDSGALHLWDLRGSKDAHMSPYCLQCGVSMGLRSPTYSTFGHHGTGHVSTVVAVMPILASTQEENQRSTCFQLASLDDRGTLTLWMVSEVGRDGRRGGAAGSEADDVGLSMGGRVRLVRTRSLQVSMNAAPKAGLRQVGSRGKADKGLNVVENSDSRWGLPEVDWDVRLCDMEMLDVGPSAVCMAFVPPELSHVLVGLESGVVLRRSRFGDTQPPLRYTRGMGVFGLSNVPSAVVAIEFSPFMSEHFLVGHADGVVSLFNAAYVDPIAQWDVRVVLDKSEAMLCLDILGCLRWSPQRPAVFYVLLRDPQWVLAYDLLANDGGPLFVQPLSECAKGDGGKKVYDGVGGLTLSLSADRPSHIAGGRTPCIAVSAPGVPGRLRPLRKGLYVTVENELQRLKALV